MAPNAYAHPPSGPVLFEYWCDESDGWCWRLNTAGGRVLAIGLRHDSEQACLDSISVIRSACCGAAICKRPPWTHRVGSGASAR